MNFDIDDIPAPRVVWVLPIAAPGALEQALADLA